MTNIMGVLAEANRLTSQPKFYLSGLNHKACVRHPAYLARIRAELAHWVGDALKAIHVQADVCRLDRLLEIEATAAHPLLFTSGQRD